MLLHKAPFLSLCFFLPLFAFRFHSRPIRPRPPLLFLAFCAALTKCRVVHKGAAHHAVAFTCDQCM